MDHGAFGVAGCGVDRGYIRQKKINKFSQIFPEGILLGKISEKTLR
jgi:hypothetical protein